MDEILIVLIVIYYIDGLVQDCSNSNANTLEILQLCTKPAICASRLRPWVMPICFFIVYIVLFQVYSLSDGYQLSPALLIFVYQRNPMTHLSSSNDIINSVNVLPLLNIRTVIHSMTISIMKIRLWDSSCSWIEVHPSPKVMADFFQTQNLSWCPHQICTILGGCIQSMQVVISCAKYIDFFHQPVLHWGFKCGKRIIFQIKFEHHRLFPGEILRIDVKFFEFQTWYFFLISPKFHFDWPHCYKTVSK